MFCCRIVVLKQSYLLLLLLFPFPFSIMLFQTPFISNVNYIKDGSSASAEKIYIFLFEIQF